MAIASAQVATKVLTDAGGATTVISFASLPTAGHGIIVYYADAVAANPIVAPTMADNQGVSNSYVKAVSVTEASAGQMAAIFRCDSIGATSGTFTLTITHNASSSNYSLINFQEINQAITLDKTTTQTTNVSQVETLTGSALSSTDELIACCYTEDSGDAGHTISADGSYTGVMNEHNTSIHIGASGDYKVVTVSTAPTCVYTSTNTGYVDAACCMATFMPASGPATTNWSKFKQLGPGQKPGNNPPLRTFKQGVPAGAPITVALTGQLATFTPGTVVPNTSVPLLGQAAAFTAGTLIPSMTVALTGQLATFTPGILSPSLSVALTGQLAVFSPGTLTPSSSLALLGTNAIFTAGTLTPSTIVPLLGQLAVFSTGTVIGSANDVTVALTGISATFSPGALTPSIDIALAGQIANFTAGILTPSGGDAQGGIGPLGAQYPSGYFPMAKGIGYDKPKKKKIIEKAEEEIEEEIKPLPKRPILTLKRPKVNIEALQKIEERISEIQALAKDAQSTQDTLRLKQLEEEALILLLM